MRWYRRDRMTAGVVALSVCLLAVVVVGVGYVPAKALGGKDVRHELTLLWWLGSVGWCVLHVAAMPTLRKCLLALGVAVLCVAGTAGLLRYGPEIPPVQDEQMP